MIIKILFVGLMFLIMFFCGASENIIIILLGILFCTQGIVEACKGISEAKQDYDLDDKKDFSAKFALIFQIIILILLVGCMIFGLVLGLKSSFM